MADITFSDSISNIYRPERVNVVDYLPGLYVLGLILYYFYSLPLRFLVDGTLLLFENRTANPKLIFWLSYSIMFLWIFGLPLLVLYLIGYLTLVISAISILTNVFLFTWSTVSINKFKSTESFSSELKVRLDEYKDLIIRSEKSVNKQRIELQAIVIINRINSDELKPVLGKSSLSRAYLVVSSLFLYAKLRNYVKRTGKTSFKILEAELEQITTLFANLA